MNPAPEGEDGEARLTIVQPKKQKTPVGVGAAEVLAADEGGLPEGDDVPVDES